MTEEEIKELDLKVAGTKLSREGYIRTVINGNTPRASPSLELIEVIKQLRKIGTNMNQIAHQANALGILNCEEYRKEYEDLQKTIDEIMMIII